MLERHKKEIAKLLDVSVNSEIIKNISDILDDTNIKEQNSFKGFQIGDIVEINKVKNIIISYDGKPEGFSEEDIRKIGEIVKFDTKTFSQKNIFVKVGNNILVGDFTSLKKCTN